MLRRRHLLACALLFTAVAVGCANTDGTSTSGTTSSSLEPTSSSATASTEPVTSASSSSSVPRPESGVTVAVYWTRPYGTARPIDVPGYADPQGGPFPFVLYGSVTNVGDEPLAEPLIAIDFLDGTSGAPIHQVVARPVDPQGQPIAQLAAGGTADLIVVVDDEAVAVRLPDAVTTFDLVTQ
jgi:hypothetical protein